MKDIIRVKRKELGLTLEQVGAAVGVGKSTVRKWECGDIPNMRRDKIVRLAAVLDVTPAYLMGWESENKKPVLNTEDGLSEAKRELIDKIRVMDDATVQALNQIAETIISKRGK